VNVSPNVFQNTFLLCIVVLTFVKNKYGRVLFISAVFKQLLFIHFMFSIVCDAVLNLFNMLIKFISYCHITFYNS
jgi:hypothetical protein